MTPMQSNQDQPIITISAITDLIKDTLEDNFAQVNLIGEISNLSVPASGHWYFTLKDSRSQLRCAMFRTTNRRVIFTPENGQQVVCRGRISLYSQRGDVQFIAESMDIDGVGSLQLAYEQLKLQLDQEGLFATQHKQQLPPYPTTIGIITSATGAAIHDIITILTRRAAGIRIILLPTLVQGDQAADEICQAIADFNHHQQAEVIIVGRGGGSLEDLQAFNSERVARAIHSSAIPIISAVGHETDFTIADFVADRRAPTPSAAAEIVIKNRQDLEQHIDQLQIRLTASIKNRLQRANQQQEALYRRLRTPAQLLQIKQQQLTLKQQQLEHSFNQRFNHHRQHLIHLTTKLHALSPLATLKRGFAAVSTTTTPKQLITTAQQLHIDDKIELRFSDAKVQAQINKITPR